MVVKTMNCFLSGTLQIKPFKKMTYKGLESRAAVTEFDIRLPPQGKIKYPACNEAQHFLLNK
jgi:hypothetical protein